MIVLFGGDVSHSCSFDREGKGDRKLGSVDGESSGSDQRQHTTVLKPGWPAKPFELACPKGTDKSVCDSFGNKASVRARCFEPEPQTQEVLSSFLTNCPECLYIDVGCNIGYFAAQAAILGAKVECYEPTPLYTDAIEMTRALNGISVDSWAVHNVAIVPDENTTSLTFSSAYRPCGVYDGRKRGKSWDVEARSIRKVLAGKHVQLLKLDIDSVEGAIFHTVVDMIKENQTFVQNILIEIGDLDEPIEWACIKNKQPPIDPYADRTTRSDDRFIKFLSKLSKKPCGIPSSHPRGGDVEDFWKMQNRYSYDVYRVNIHVAREIFDWTGTNINGNMAPQREGLQSMYNIRNMKKLEKILPSQSSDTLRNMNHYGVSLLFTREQLADVAVQHRNDLAFAHLSAMSLNQGNPLFGP